jgi:hypothetical protein
MSHRWMSLGPQGAKGPVVYPIGDIHPHDIDNEDCPCRPFWDGEVLVHQSCDKREASEPTGQLQ